MLAESLLLASVGGAAGLLVARWTLDAVARFRPLDVARLDHIPIDTRAAVIACGVTILAALIAGSAPSLQLSRPSSVATLWDGRGSARRGIRGALVTIEVAAMVVAIGAGLLMRSFVAIQRVDPGFTRDRVATLQIFTTRRLETPEQRILFFQQALDRIRALPGVVSAGGVTAMPFGMATMRVRAPLTIDGRVPASGEASLIDVAAVAGDYFQAVDVPLVQGRPFDGGAGRRQEVLVSQTAARKFWPGANPIGSRVRFTFAGMPYEADVIGIVGDVHRVALDQPAAAELFVPYRQSGFYALTLVVRTAPGSQATLQVLKEQVWALDPRQPIFHTGTLDDLISQSLVGRRFSALLLGGFALATLILAAAGVYGVMSFSTSQRTREFGVRIALGASRRDIVSLYSKMVWRRLQSD